MYRGQDRGVGTNAIAIGDTALEAAHIVIATASRLQALPIPGAEHFIISDDIPSRRESPRDVVFIGGGVTAIEFSHVYARAGDKVASWKPCQGRCPIWTPIPWLQFASKASAAASRR
ncbi:MAG TPA: FAD-dependent oxidoreductase [Hyphomicrobiaceae bacterium]|nr:FAD-dependent oxidoreductase [Hyphomicrobiaceae bacterium]